MMGAVSSTAHAAHQRSKGNRSRRTARLRDAPWSMMILSAEAEWISRLRQHTQKGRDSRFGGTHKKESRSCLAAPAAPATCPGWSGGEGTLRKASQPAPQCPSASAVRGRGCRAGRALRAGSPCPARSALSAESTPRPAALLRLRAARRALLKTGSCRMSTPRSRRCGSTYGRANSGKSW
jgi:hypothetical protein